MSDDRATLDRVAVALDTANRSEFSEWCRYFGPKVGVLKVGLQAYVEWGRDAVDEALEHGSSVFLDLKLHDIPNTVAGAVGAARSLGVDLLTVHASGGRRMLEAAAGAAGDTRIIAVTVLTHLAEDDLEELDFPGSSEERARRYAELARSSGCAGVVCSPLELSRLRPSCPPPFRLVTPGIRPGSSEARLRPEPRIEASPARPLPHLRPRTSGAQGSLELDLGKPDQPSHVSEFKTSPSSTADDQRRVSTPGDALAAGSDLLVIGRPLTRAADKEEALEQLRAEIAGR